MGAFVALQHCIFVQAGGFSHSKENILKSNTLQNPPSAILRIQDSAKYIAVSRAFLYQLIDRGELVKIKLGGRAAGIRRSDLDAWINTQAAR